MYSSFHEPSSDAWLSSAAKFLSADERQVRVESVEMSDACKVGENFTTVMKRARVQVEVDG